MVRIFIPTPLRKFTADKSIVEVQAATITEAIEGLAKSFPELDQHLFDSDRSIRKFVRIFLGDQDIHQLNGAATQLKAGDEVSIIPAIAGGKPEHENVRRNSNSNTSANSNEPLRNKLSSHLPAT